MPYGVQVRPATRADVPRVVDVLAQAFADDPVVSHLLPDGTPYRDRRLHALFRLDVPRSQRLGGAWTTGDGTAAAVWFPPGHARPRWWETALQGPPALRVFGRRMPTAMRVLEAMQGQHPREPHHYLYYLGATPSTQSTGRGSALLEAVLAECDEQRVPAYLEATHPRNRELYARHGFEVRTPLELPGDGPTLYPMWRDPRPR